MLMMAGLVAGEQRPAAAGSGSISIDAGAVQGVVQPTVTGQMAEWAYDEMNGAWAERLRNRSFEVESVDAQQSSLYDAFTGTALDHGKWTPVSLDGAPAGTATVANSALTLTTAAPGRWGVMSDELGETRYTATAVETKVTATSGTNAILHLNGSSSGTFTNYVEFAIEGGQLKVFGEGITPWAGGAATTPGTLRITVSGQSGSARDLQFHYNGALVHSISGATMLPATFRAFLYSFSGSMTVDTLTVSHDDTYDGFGGTALSPRWTMTALAGSSTGASASVGSGRLQISGSSDSRYAALSQPIRNSAVDWTRIDARLTSVSGTNGLLNVYGGTGSGDFSKFVEFGIEGGVAKMFTADGASWTGGGVTLPATLSVEVSPFYADGRTLRFFVNGTQVHERQDDLNVPKVDFRLALYGWSTSTTEWDRIGVSRCTCGTSSRRPSRAAPASAWSGPACRLRAAGARPTRATAN
jgi:hypothetical protein